MTMNDSNHDDKTLFEYMAEQLNPADPTELPRRIEIQRVNANLSPDEQVRYDQLVEEYGADNVWDTNGITREFSIEGFMAPYCVVIRKSDGVKGSVQFCNSPRFYFNFKEA